MDKKYFLLVSLVLLLSPDLRSSADWELLGGATDMTGGTGNQAGYSVSMNSAGTMIAVGERDWQGDASLIGDPSYHVGRVLVYIYNSANNSWDLTGGALDMIGETGECLAGSSVAMNSDGLTVAVGEPAWSGGANFIGRVRVFNLAGGSWVLNGGAFDMTGENSSDSAGTSVAINSDGSIVAVGEPGYDSGNGRVRVFQYSGGLGSWTSIGGFTGITGENNFGQAGSSVALSSNGLTVAVGEPGWSGGLGVGGGRVRVFNLAGGSWVLAGGATDMTGENQDDLMGHSVSLDSAGLRVAVGEPGWSAADFKGRVRVYDLTGGSWVLTGGALDGGANNYRYGHSVALNSNGNILAVGEPGWAGTEPSNGRMLVFELQGGSWVLISDPLAMTGIGLSEAGISVAINDAGTIAAMGEPSWNPSVGGAFAHDGRVRAYSSNGTPTPPVSDKKQACMLTHIPTKVSAVRHVASTREEIVSTFALCDQYFYYGDNKC